MFQIKKKKKRERRKSQSVSHITWSTSPTEISCEAYQNCMTCRLWNSQVWCMLLQNHRNGTVQEQPTGCRLVHFIHIYSHHMYCTPTSTVTPKGTHNGKTHRGRNPLILSIHYLPFFFTLLKYQKWHFLYFYATQQICNADFRWALVRCGQM